MSYSFKLISHPSSKSNQNPRLLVDHLREVGYGARELVGSLDIDDLCINGENISKSQLEELAYIIGISHDFGKGTSFFQKYLQTHKKTEESRHAPLSSLFAFHLSNKLLRSPILSYIAFLTVYYHHGDLASPVEVHQHLEDGRQVKIAEHQKQNILVGSLEEMDEIYKSLLPELSSSVSKFLKGDGIINAVNGVESYISEITGNGSPLVDAYFLVMLMYSALLYADKMSASGIGYENAKKDRKSFDTISSDLVDKYRETLKWHGNKNPELLSLRTSSYSDALNSLKSLNIRSQRMMRLELPTGLGKTTIAFGAALELRDRVQKETGNSPRIIYALPFITIIDQNFQVFSEILSQSFGNASHGTALPSSLLLQHHHLSDVYYTFRGEDNPSDTDSIEPSELARRYLLMEGWNSEVIVTTFVQLFHTLISNRNASSMKFHSLINSIIILDEVQAVPYKYQSLVIEMLSRLTELFNSWVIVMTATMPDSFLQSKTTDLIPESKKYFNSVDRVVYRYIKDPMDFDTLATEYILKREDKDVLVVVNTIKASKELYLLLKTLLSRKYDSSQWNDEGGYTDFGSTILTVLSTNITPADRKKRIATIKDSRKRKIVVSTQLIEAGVDIDMDVIIRDISPIDSIVQAAGRANRESVKAKGEVLIVNLQDERGNSYSRRVYDQVDLGQSFDIMKEAFPDGSPQMGLTEREFHEKVRSYYHRLRDVKSDNVSMEMLLAVNFLKYTEISKFRWIEDDIPRVDIFVPINDEAKRVWKAYMESFQLPPLERKNKVLSFRNSFYQYVISVPRTSFDGAIDPIINPIVSHRKKVEEFYDKETGFKGEKAYGAGSSYAEW